VSLRLIVAERDAFMAKAATLHVTAEISQRGRFGSGVAFSGALAWLRRDRAQRAPQLH
jgi:hypothetical protein